MRIAIYGTGAIGGVLAGYLGQAGHEIVTIARGANLEALRAGGLRLVHEVKGVDVTVAVEATDDPASVGPVDVVFVTAKGPALPGIGKVMGPLLGTDTPVVYAINGIPWWYDHGFAGEPTGVANLLDPDGDIRRVVGMGRAIGCVIDCPTRVEAPGHVVTNAKDRPKFTLGEPTGAKTDRVGALAAAMEEAGLAAPVSTDIRFVIWAKLLLNISRSPLAVLTGADEYLLAEDRSVAAISRSLIEEAAAVAARHGIELPLDWPFLLDPSERYDHMPSMGQDWLLGRPMEVDSILGAVLHFADASGVPAPTLATIHALLRQKARVAGLY